MDKEHRQWEQKKVEFHNRILARLKCDEHAYIGQYKEIYFHIFKEAYESGFCWPLRYTQRFFPDGTIRIEWIHTKPKVSGDSIWYYAVEQSWCHFGMSGNEQRYQQIQTVMTWWDEWTYAWRNLGHKTQCHRNIDEGL